MRFLKRILVSVLIYAAIYLPFVVIMQAISMTDYTAAYTVGGLISSAELILCALIKREETKQEMRNKKNDNSRIDTVDNTWDNRNSGDSDSSDTIYQSDTSATQRDDK